MKQKGMALLVVLLTLSLMAGLAVNMTTRFQTSLKRTEFQRDTLQARWYFRLAEEAALDVLQQELLDNPELSAHHQFWAQPQTLFPDDDITLSWRLQSGQDCYNLNTLAKVPTDSQQQEPYNVAVFRALLQQNGVEGLYATELIAAIADYIDADETPRRDGAEDDSYSDQPLRYVANQPLFSVSEIRAIKGMNANLWRKLMPWLCALDNTDLQINVNTLTPDRAPLLSALFLNNLDIDASRRLLEQAPQNGWTDAQQIIKAAQEAHPALKEEISVIKAALTSRSDYFVLTSTVSLKDTLFRRRHDIVYQRQERQLHTRSSYRLFDESEEKE